MEDDKSVQPKQPPSLPANYVTIVELQERWIKERQRKEKEKQDQERRMQKEKERSEKQRDSNYVTICDLQERWIKERQRKDKEKQDQEWRMREEKERSEKQLRRQKEIDTKKVELAPGCSYRRFPPSNNRNAVPRRENLEVGRGGEREGLGHNGDGEQSVGRGRYRRWSEKPKPRAEGEVTVEGGSCRVGRKSEDAVVEHGDLGQEGALKIEEKFGNLSLKGANREISARANGPRIGGSRMHVALQCVPKAEVISVNEERCHGTEPRRNGGNGMKRNVDNGNADKVLVCDQSGSNPNINLGNKMQRNVKIDGKLEKVPMGNARGRSNTNITKSNEMDMNVNVDGELGSTSSNGSKRMDGTVGIDGKLEIVPIVGDNSSNGGNRVNKNVHTEGKCEKVPITARGRCYSRVEMNGFKRVVRLDRPEMVWVKKGEVSDGNTGRIQNSGRYSKGSK